MPSTTRTLGLLSSTSTAWSANYFSIAPYLSDAGITTTSTYSYDANGNLAQWSTGADSSTYGWDYANRLVQSVASATTTYGYDHLGQRVFQQVGSTTTLYPSRFYSISAITNGATTTATSTEYLYLGDQLVASVAQQLVNGVATGTPATSYVHADHLGSTMAVTSAVGVPVQRVEYYPYGAERINNSTGEFDSKRKYDGMERDTSTGLDYAMARYYDNARGQFLSEDPVFWEIGHTPDGRAVLSDPQLQNSYSWGRDNPITQKDPDGRCPVCVPIAIGGGVGFIGGIGTQAFNDYLSGDFGRRSFQENLGAYGVAGVSGATVGVGTVAAGIAAPFVGITGVGATIAAGGVSGTLTGLTSVAGDRLLGQQTDYGGLAVNVGLSALTAGTLKSLPAVRGRLPNFGTSAFYTGAHTARQGAEEFFSSSIQSFGQTAYRSAPAFSGGSSGGGSRGSIVQQLQSIVSALQGIVASLSGSSNKK